MFKNKKFTNLGYNTYKFQVIPKRFKLLAIKEFQLCELKIQIKKFTHMKVFSELLNLRLSSPIY